MRRRTTFLVFIALTCLAGGLATAAPKPKTAAVIPPKPGSAQALRGPIDAAPSRDPVQRAALRGFSPLPSQIEATPYPAGQCRSACAQSYYLCQADQDAGSSCSQSWSSCVVGCSPSTIPFITSPAT
jgi:hypothetical protein